MADIPLIHLDRPVHPDDVAYLDGRAELIGPADATLGQAPAAVIGVQYYWDAERFAKFPNLKVISRAGMDATTSISPRPKLPASLYATAPIRPPCRPPNMPLR